MTSLLLVSVVALATCMLITPTVQKLAWALNITDRPDGHRKLHGQPIPLGGGVAVFIGMVAAVVMGYFAPTPWQSVLQKEGGSLLALLGAAVAVLIVGLADDRFGLRGRHKLLGQLWAATILVGSGLLIRNVSIFDFEIQLGLLAVPCTLFWLVGAMNALNLIDGMDGSATTVGIILSISISVMAMLTGHPAEALVMAALAGSLLGFLRFNFPPAKMFLGDAGSMLIGLVIGALAIRGALKGPATIGLAAPLAVWTIPILDSAAAIIRRKLTGRSIYTTDRGHLHHCLLARSGSTPRTLVWIGLCCAITSIGGLVTIWLKNDLIATVCSLSLVGTLVATRVFGYGEFLLLSGKVRGVLLSLVNISGTKHGQARQATVRLQGSRPWELLWASLIESADKFSVNTIRLDVNMPAYHEGYHASWVRPTKRDDSDLWRTEIPLHAGERVIGRLTITGDRDGISACEVIERLMDLLQPFEAQTLELAVNGYSTTKSTSQEKTSEREATVTPNGSGTTTVVAPAASLKIANGRPTRDREFLPHVEVSKCAL